MKQVIGDKYLNIKDTLRKWVSNFENLGEEYCNQERNTLKIFKVENLNVNIKSFKIPNLINKIAYKYLRKSKAQRSFEYATKLTELGIGTPHPIAYFENSNIFGLKDSYYLSEHLSNDITYRELTRDLNYPDHEKILRGFTRFTYRLHQNDINFLDHSPGNTLIKKVGNEYTFYIVDLNRMEFKSMSFETRIKNFARLTTSKSMVETMSDEYAKISGEDYDKIVELMWRLTEVFQKKYYRKIRLKKKLKFWKN